MNGNEILVYYGANAIAMSKSCEIQTSAELREVASLSSNRFREYIVGRKEWSVTVSNLVTASSAIGNSSTGIRDVLSVGTTFSLKIKKRGDGDVAGLSGSAILKTVKIDAIRGDLVKGSFQFVGTSALT